MKQPKTSALNGAPGAALRSLIPVHHSPVNSSSQSAAACLKFFAYREDGRAHLPGDSHTIFSFLFPYQLLSGATNRSCQPCQADRTQQLDTHGSPWQSPSQLHLIMGAWEHVSQGRFYLSSLAGSSSSVLRKVPEMDKAPSSWGGGLSDHITWRMSVSWAGWCTCRRKSPCSCSATATTDRHAKQSWSAWEPLTQPREAGLQAYQIHFTGWCKHEVESVDGNNEKESRTEQRTGSHRNSVSIELVWQPYQEMDFFHISLVYGWKFKHFQQVWKQTSVSLFKSFTL